MRYFVLFSFQYLLLTRIEISIVAYCFLMSVEQLGLASVVNFDKEPRVLWFMGKISRLNENIECVGRSVSWLCCRAAFLLGFCNQKGVLCLIQSAIPCACVYVNNTWINCEDRGAQEGKHDCGKVLCRPWIPLRSNECRSADALAALTRTDGCFWDSRTVLECNTMSRITV